MPVYKIALILFLPLLAISSSADESTEPNVKKSNARVCYEKGSAQYGDIKTYTSFDSLEDCQLSGGRISPDSAVPTPTPTVTAGKEKVVPTRLPQQL